MALGRQWSYHGSTSWPGDAENIPGRGAEQLRLLPEEAYHDAARFADMPSDWAPWELIAGNTIWHYPDHMGAIRRLLEE